MGLFIGIKRLAYGDPMTEKPTKLTSFDDYLGALENGVEIHNVHQGTWGYTQDDPSVTDYINELTGKPYYRDAEDMGNKTINFTIGQYELQMKADLQGGEVVDGVWESPTTPTLINKAIVAETKTGGIVIFPNAGIVAKTDTQEKNLGLGLSAVAMENQVEQEVVGEGGAKTTQTVTIAEEYWVDAPSA